MSTFILTVISAKPCVWSGFPSTRLPSVGSLCDGGLAGGREEASPHLVTIPPDRSVTWRVVRVILVIIRRFSVLLLLSFVLLVVVCVVCVVRSLMLNWCHDWCAKQKHDSSHGW